MANDMSDIRIICQNGTRTPTKYEVIRALFLLVFYGRKEKGLLMKRLSSAWTKFCAAPLKASQASWLQETLTEPVPRTSSSVT